MFRQAGEAKACLRIDAMPLNVSVFIVRSPLTGQQKTARRRFKNGVLALSSDHVRVIRIQRVIYIRYVIARKEWICVTWKGIAATRKRFVIRNGINVIWTISHKASVKLCYERLFRFTRFLFALLILILLRLLRLLFRDMLYGGFHFGTPVVDVASRHSKTISYTYVYIERDGR